MCSAVIKDVVRASRTTRDAFGLCTLVQQQFKRTRRPQSIGSDQLIRTHCWRDRGLFLDRGPTERSGVSCIWPINIHTNTAIVPHQGAITLSMVWEGEYWLVECWGKTYTLSGQLLRLEVPPV